MTVTVISVNPARAALTVEAASASPLMRAAASVGATVRSIATVAGVRPVSTLVSVGSARIRVGKRSGSAGIRAHARLRQQQRLKSIRGQWKRRSSSSLGSRTSVQRVMMRVARRLGYARRRWDFLSSPCWDFAHGGGYRARRSRRLSTSLLASRSFSKKRSLPSYRGGFKREGLFAPKYAYFAA